MTQFDLFTSRQARDLAIIQVSENSGEFITDAIRIVRQIPQGSFVTGEDVRRIVTDAGVNPHHHNAWGGLISACIKRGLIRDTGKYVPMKDVRSHARRTPVYAR